MTTSRSRLLMGLPMRDLVVGAALVAVGVLDTRRHSSMPHPATELWVLLGVGAIALRTRAPLVMCLVAAVGLDGFALMPGTGTPLWGLVALLVLAFSAGSNLSGRRRASGLGVLLVAAYVLQVVTSARLEDEQLSWADVWVTPVVLVGVPAVAGALLQRARRQTALVRALAAELAAERDAHAASAVLAERNRIARELHDVISHSVSVMVVQAGAAENLLPDDSAALEPVRRVRQTGREAMGELRRQLGLLREGDPVSPTPMPGLHDLPALVSSMDARLATSGDVSGVHAPGLELAAYRVVQEALTNARRHADGAAVTVQVSRLPAALELTVLDGGGGAAAGQPGTGHGLLGLRERVALYGGSLDAGPRTDAPGWRVFARLPVGGEG